MINIFPKKQKDIENIFIDVNFENFFKKEKINNKTHSMFFNILFKKS